MTRQPATDSIELHKACHSPDALIQAAAYETLWRYLYQVTFQVVRDQPEAEDLAQDCAQLALIRIHNRLAECRQPAAFRAWARRIAAHIAIDELRRRKRLLPLFDDESPGETDPAPATNAHSSPETAALEAISLSDLHTLLNQAPISHRSRRVVGGRYLDGAPDEHLAQVESQLAHRTVLPSHIQVTRAKNIAKLRQWEPLQTLWKTGE